MNFICGRSNDERIYTKAKVGRGRKSREFMWHRKRIFKRRVLEEEELLMRLKACDWVFGEKSANVEANCTRLLSVAAWEVVVRNIFAALSVSELEGALSLEDIVMTADANRGTIETRLLLIMEVSLSEAAGGKTEPEVITSNWEWSEGYWTWGWKDSGSYWLPRVKAGRKKELKQDLLSDVS